MIKSNRTKLGKVYIDLAMKRLLKAGFVVERQAKVLVAVDTGRLRASLSTNITGGPVEGKVGRKAEAKGIGAPTTPYTVVVGSNVEYAPDVELGTSRQSAQPFLRPALFGSRNTIRKIMGSL